MNRCRECGGIEFHHSGCPEDPGLPELPEADEDERGGEYEDDKEPTTIDCWKMLDGVWAAWEAKRHG